MLVFEKLGIYGWKEQDENICLASLLTGEPLLLVASHGTAKTGLFYRIAQLLRVKSIAYDTSKVMLEDFLGYPNVEELRQGKISYIPSPITIWDKEFILLDELNRALSSTQSKWLEVIRSRKIMGFPTKAMWVWAAMNPLSYLGTETLDEALIGRFAFFVFPPDMLSMSEKDREQIICLINGDDAPALQKWTGETLKTFTSEQLAPIGEDLLRLLRTAGVHFKNLLKYSNNISTLLSRFAELLARETKDKVQLDGRRAGYMKRNILAVRAIEFAKQELHGSPVPTFQDSAKYTVFSSIPTGINEEATNREDIRHKVEVVFDLLAGYLDEKSDIAGINTIYELFTTPESLRKVEILLTTNLNDLVKLKAWNDLLLSEGSLLAGLAAICLYVEQIIPGRIPVEVLEPLSKTLNKAIFSTEEIPLLEEEDIEYSDDLTKLVHSSKTKLETFLVCQEITKISRPFSPEKIQKLKETLDTQKKKLRELLGVARGSN